jgi:putative DNA primase/helicase
MASFLNTSPSEAPMLPVAPPDALNGVPGARLRTPKVEKKTRSGSAHPARVGRIDRFAHTDSGNAERLVLAYGQDFRYVHDWKQWVHWDGKRWRRDATAEIYRAAKDTIRLAYSCLSEITNDDKRLKLAKWLRLSESRKGREAMVKLASMELKVSSLSSDFDIDPMLLNLRNGTMDLRTRRLRAHRREDMLTKLCPIDSVPSAKCERWTQFLDEIFLGKQDLIEFIQRSIGYTLSGSAEEQCFWLLVGPGKNGKSKFLDTIEFMMGDYAVPTSFSTFTARRHDSAAISPRDGLASLATARFVRASESDQGTRISEATIKALTGGEAIRTARMYQEDFSYIPKFKIWLSTNHELMIRGTDDGIWRRIRKVPFDYVVPDSKRDLELSAKLRAEASGWLNWALKGWKKYRRGGLMVPQSVLTATNDYRNAQNIVGRFLDAATEEEKGSEIEATELYATFVQWRQEEDEEEMSQTAFGIETKKRLESRRNSAGRTVYLGIRLSVRL